MVLKNKRTNYNIDFNFGNSDTMYLTHSLHPYPAKFPTQLTHTIIKKFANRQATILDSFHSDLTRIYEEIGWKVPLFNNLEPYNATEIDAFRRCK